MTSLEPNIMLKPGLSYKRGFLGALFACSIGAIVASTHSDTPLLAFGILIAVSTAGAAIGVLFVYAVKGPTKPPDAP
jgi:hypothetical protein